VTLPLPLLLIFAVLLGAWLTWLAVRRADRRRRIWRLVATWVSVVSLALLLSPPSCTRTYSASEAILLTEGYHPDSLRSLQARLQPKPQVFQLSGTATEGIPVPDLAAFQARYPAVQTLHVLGHGLEEEDLASLKAIRLVPHLAVLPTGVLAASWPQKITLGEELQVQGKFNAPTQATRLYLQAAGSPCDSLEIKPGREQSFAFRFTPKATGQFVYTLQWKGKVDSVQEDALPVTVQAPRTLAVLILAAAPAFEVKFLKNALAQKGHGVAVRSQVSKGVYQTEQINLSGLALRHLSGALLQKFDMVVLDGASLQGLSTGEKQALQQAVRQQGLGLLTCFSENRPKRIPFFAEAGLRQISEKQARNATVQWEGQNGVVLPVSGSVWQPLEGQQALVWEKNPHQALAVHYRKGLGQVGVSLLAETFPWALEGKEKLYQAYWDNMLTTLAKPSQEKEITFEPVWPQLHQPLLVELAEENLKEPKLKSEASGKTVSLVASAASLLPLRQTYTTWPQEKGWHSLPLNGEGARFYVYPQTAWHTYRLQARQQATMAAAVKPQASPNANTAVTRQETLPLWPFGLSLLLTLGFLWLEEKL
jgi:hypothetical protein